MIFLILIPLLALATYADCTLYRAALTRHLAESSFDTWEARGWKRFLPGSGFYLITQYPSK